MTNELITKFTVDDSDLIKVDIIHKKLTDVNRDVNNLGKDASFGKTIADNFTTAGLAVNTFKTKVENSASQPTISRYWQTESQMSVSSLKTIDTAFSKTTGLANAGAESLKRMSEFKFEQPNFGKPDNALFSEVEKARKSVSEFNKQRIDTGKFDGLTKAGVRLHDQLGRVQTDISRINLALTKAANQTVIDKLNKDLIVADNSFAKLNSRISQYESRQNNINKGSIGRDSKFNNLRGFSPILEQFAPPGVNQSSIEAISAAAQIAKIGTASLITFGAIVVVGVGIIKITESIRKESERRLKVEEQIQSAINNQILSQKAALNNFKTLREQSVADREFSRTLNTGSVDELKSRRDLAEKLFSLSPTGSNAENFKKTIIEIDTRLEAISQQNTVLANQTFNQGWENWKKSQQSAMESAIEAQKKFNQEIEKGKVKVEELGKTYNSVFDNLYQKQGLNNPFVSFFSEADKSLKSLRENTQGLSADLIGQFEAIEQKANSLKLFETRIDNRLQAFDLRDQAANFRNGGKTELDKKFFEDAIKNSISRGGYLTGLGGTFGSDLAGKAGGYDKLTDAQKRDIYEVSVLSGFQNRKKDAFFEGNLRSATSLLARERIAAPNENLSLNERLEKQSAIIFGAASTNEEKSLADRKFIALTQGANPNELSGRVREQAAASREREAARLEKAEQEAREQRSYQLKISEQIRDEIKKLNALAEKEGFAGVIKIIDESGGKVDVARRPSQRDTQNQTFGLGFAGGTNR